MGRVWRQADAEQGGATGRGRWRVDAEQCGVTSCVRQRVCERRRVGEARASGAEPDGLLAGRGTGAESGGARRRAEADRAEALPSRCEVGVVRRATRIRAIAAT